jgi:hypothetical protein
VAKKRDWDQEGRERRAREHGRVRARVDLEADADLESVIKFREDVEREQFRDQLYAYVEPARLVARTWRQLPGDERPSRREEYLQRVREALGAAAASTVSDSMRRAILGHYTSLARTFGKKTGGSG